MKIKPIQGARAAILSCILLSATVTFAQQTAINVNGLTPKQLTDGTAKYLSHASPNQMLRLVLGLEHPKQVEEEQFVHDVMTKGSPVFQHFLTAAQWNARFSPSVQDEQAVIDWAVSHGLTVSHRFPNRLLVDIEAPVVTVEKAFGLSINNYQLGSKTVFSNDRNPTIPATLAHVIHSVGGLNNMQVLRPSSKTLPEPDFASYVAGPVAASGSTGGASATAKRPTKKSGLHSNITGGAYDPTDIYSSQAYDVNGLYSLGHCCNPLNNAGVTPPESSIAIATAGTQNGTDFAGFHNSYPYLAYHYQQFYIDGTPSCCDGEGTLDFDWTTAMANSFGSYVDTAMIYMYDGVNNQFSTFTDVYNQILTDQKAKVFSTSWGCEELNCTPQSVMDTDHGIFNAMVGQGMTLVAATGDQGATAGCNSHLAVQYPASDPNIVGAGGNTLLLDSSSKYFSETAWSGGPSGCSSNDGGSTGGISAYYATPSYQSSLGVAARAVPDIALNADWYNSPQNMYFNGALSGNGGTSIVAPEVAGFFAQANAYMDYVATINGGCYGGTTCAPIGNGNYYLYYFGENSTYAPHYPFYDITSGCNNNDVTSTYGLGDYCAASGYDEVTGWGSFNALQLSWAINTYRAGDFIAPSTTLTGPTINFWYNTDQYVQWSITDNGGSGLPATGVSGFTQSWDSYPYDSFSEAIPGSGDGFYSGPTTPNSSSGSSYVSSVGQGCHTAYVRAYDNSGFNSVQSYGPVCFDNVAPVTTAALSGTFNGSVYTSAVTVTLSPTDATSGVSATYYSLDGSGYITYHSPFSIAGKGSHTLAYYSVDKANNTETVHSLPFTIESTTTTTVSTNSNPSYYGQGVKFVAHVQQSFGAAVFGTVTFLADGTAFATANVINNNAGFTVTTLHGGAHSITATYNGSGADLTSTSSGITETITKAASTTTMTSSLNPSKHNQSVQFLATIASAFGGSVSGTVTFKDGGTTIGTAPVSIYTNRAAFSTTALAGGNHTISAIYNGSTDDYGSTSSGLAQTVNMATTTTGVTSSLNPSAYNRAVTFKATVTPQFGGTATGIVSFKDGSTLLGTGTLASNQTTFTTSSLSAATHSITAVYGGDSGDVTSTSSVLSETVNVASTTTGLTASTGSASYNQPITLTATVSPAFGGSATGTVSFIEGSTLLGTGTVVSNQATFTTSTLSLATHSITAVYGGSSNVSTSTSSAISVTVHKASSATALVSSVNPSTLNQSVTFTASVTGGYGGSVAGTVTFKDGSTTIVTGMVNSANGQATFTTSTLIHGTHSITAVYNGSTNFYGSTSPAVSQVVN